MSLSKFPAAWVPSLYFTESLPYMLINIVAVPMYLALGLSEELIPLYVGFLGYAWTVKPLWSPVVELRSTRRNWTLAMQFILTIGFALVGMVIGTGQYFLVSFSLLAILSVVSATHDIAIDGLYLEVLSEKHQSFYVGIRTTFYRIGLFFAKGPLLIVVGMIMAGKISFFGEDPGAATAYQWGWYLCAGIFAVLWVYHYFFLPDDGKVSKEQSEKIEEIGGEGESVLSEPVEEERKTIKELLISFFDKPQIGIMVLFLLFYRLGESQIQTISQTFLMNTVENGGLGISTEVFGILYGTYGSIALIAGGILGGVVISRDGLKKWLWPMLIAINLPNAAYVYLAYAQPDSHSIISYCIALEQFGYGFGFTAFVMYMIYIAKGKYQTAHYAFATGIMALGNIIPMQFSGFIKEAFADYTSFFIWTLVATIPAFVITAFIPLDSEFGKKDKE
ncbi:MAG: MFS transporter [Bacteroidota bacterium]